MTNLQQWNSLSEWLTWKIDSTKPRVEKLLTALFSHPYAKNRNPVLVPHLMIFPSPLSQGFLVWANNLCPDWQQGCWDHHFRAYGNLLIQKRNAEALLVVGDIYWSSPEIAETWLKSGRPFMECPDAHHALVIEGLCTEGTTTRVYQATTQDGAVVLTPDLELIKSRYTGEPLLLRDMQQPLAHPRNQSHLN